MTESAMLPLPDLLQSLLTLLEEAYPGPPDPGATWFIDNEPDAGILGTIKGVTAAEASVSMDGSGKPGTTIASNVEHLRWSLANVNNTLRGGEYSPDWRASWTVVEVDEAGWDRLRGELRREYEDLCEAIPRVQALDEVWLNGMLALIPHAAFHLGLVRQMIERVRAQK
ncbi:MAG TPA: hypothetical protein GYA06_09095 [Chloroflexi bacterium]|jgi:hypothetical protein|nr:hypothetical protein [Chloroflexota bacterium]HPO59561.1 hypothetical protein [Anaerolineaceae bacterium]